MIAWIVFAITFTSHIGLIYLFEQQRKQLQGARSNIRHLKNVIVRQRRTLFSLEAQLRILSRRLTK